MLIANIATVKNN